MAAAAQTNALADVVAGYWANPKEFALDCMEGVDLDTWQAKFLDDLGAAVLQRNFVPPLPSEPTPAPVEPIRMTVASGHGIGKSTLIAIIHWWIMCTRPGCIMRVTANTFDQLQNVTWASIKRWHGACRLKDWFEVTDGRIWAKCRPLHEEWYSFPVTCREENKEAFAGQHNARGSSVYLFDEASLIPDAIWDVASKGLTDGESFHFAFGNSYRNTGMFFEVNFGKFVHRWDRRSINAMECKYPNKAELQKDVDDYGWDSDHVKMTIRGLPPAQSEDQLISRDLVQEAQKRHVELIGDEPLVAGVDIPDGGSAWFVVRYRRGLDARPGALVPAPLRYPGSRVDRGAMVTILAGLLRGGTSAGRIAAMFIDRAYGAAIVERLRALNFDNVFEIGFDWKSPDPGYGNMRAYMWGKELKEWLAKGAIDPNDQKLEKDLVAPGFHRKVGGDGALVLESKDEMKRRGQPSPDDGDALALTFARPVKPEERGGSNQPWESTIDTNRFWDTR